MSAHVEVEAQTSRTRVEAASCRADTSSGVLMLKRRTISPSYLVLKCAGLLDLDALVHGVFISGLDGPNMASIEASRSHANCSEMARDFCESWTESRCLELWWSEDHGKAIVREDDVRSAAQTS